MFKKDRCFRSSFTLKALPVMSVVALIATSCGGGSDDDDNDSGGIISQLSTTSIADMPNLSTFLSSSGNATALAALSGTPPAFADIDTVAEVATYLTGDVDAIISSITTKVAAQDWTGVEAEIEGFNAAYLKCEMMQTTLENLSTLREQTTSACYVSEIGQANAGVLTHESGTQYSDDRAVFAPNSDGSEKIVRLNPGDDQYIMIAISVANKVLKYELDFCDATTAAGRGRDTIELDNSRDGQNPTVKLTSQHSDTFTEDGVSAEFAFQGTLNGEVVKAADGSVSFASGVERTFEGSGFEKGKAPGGTFRHAYRTKISVNDSEMIVRDRDSGFDEFLEGTTKVRLEGVERAVYGVTYSGDTIGKTAISAGAGRRLWRQKATEGATVYNEKGVDKVAFSYNEAATPRYESKGDAAAAIVAKLKAIDFKADGVLKEKPAKPTFDFSASRCSATPTSTYALNLENAAFATIAAECENDLDDDTTGDDLSLCEGIAQAQDEVLSALDSLQTGCPTCDVNTGDATLLDDTLVVIEEATE